MKKIPSSEITPEELYNSRRRFIKSVFKTTAASILISSCSPQKSTEGPEELESSGSQEINKSYTDDQGSPATSYQDIINYVNFYEFSTSKSHPPQLYDNFKPSPWTIHVDGFVNHPRTFDIDEIMNLFDHEERVYRMRCVEGWSMIIPWVGFPLKKLLDVVEPTSDAKYVRFETLHDPEQMDGQHNPSYPWPYIEGLRMDEAMHDLTLLSTGIYGKDLQPQNGAPIRLVVPWKYGFKSIKSIVRIDLVSEMPTSLWMAVGPTEYGFYSNVNPNVNHPRWSQASEQRIGQSGRINTQMFNGYEEEVAYLYEGMDLKVYF